MKAPVRRLTADQETSLPEHDELLSLACEHHDVIAAKAFLQDESCPGSRRRLSAFRDAGLKAFREKLDVTLEALTRTINCHTGTATDLRVRSMLDTFDGAKSKVQALLDGRLPIPHFSARLPVEHLASEVMHPLHDASTPRTQSRKRIVGYVDLALTLRRISSATISFPSFVSPLRWNQEPSLFSANTPHLDRAVQSARAIIGASPTWQLDHAGTSHVWITVRSQQILIGEVLQELKQLRERMRDEAAPGHAAVVGPMTEAVRQLIEAEGFLVFDRGDLLNPSQPQLAELSCALPCDISLFAQSASADARQAVAA